MNLRDANTSDLDDMTRLLEQLFSIEADFQFDAQKHQAALRHIIQSVDCVCKVATNEQDRVIGMGTAQWVYSTATGNKSAWIEDLVIDQKYRSQGIGQQLLNQIIECCQKAGCSRAQLVYDLENDAAIEFYRKQSFNQTRLGVFSKPV
ncbi:MAG: GNAT family N-acetyltransferase [Thiomicrorhabdus chilensis]|uniref:GNAT family N-acetyltransferase n=1 Tax=Thiomicrorhabdus chilensis TaxID=63656 RepID=UPI00299D242E|nr:GNAT family N-acetyltransferase [Thiomicrorhabdus chilensis]MDX1347403.1 GNAT family N-acetyltransferase [Thiomicrorhabdus chilensis]